MKHETAAAWMDTLDSRSKQGRLKARPERTDRIPGAGIKPGQPQVCRDIMARKSVAIAKYGRPLRPNNGRDAMRDAYEEALDLAQYLKQAMIERDEKAR